MTKPVCPVCGKADQVLLRRTISAGGANMIAWRCTACQTAPNPGEWLKHDTVRKIIGSRYTLDDIPIWEDYRASCAICGQLGAQVHHFFPQMFSSHEEVKPAWGQWSTYTADLCQYHHDLWHDLVTPWMHGRGTSRK